MDDLILTRTISGTTLLRCYLVYGGGSLAGMGLLWLFTELFGMSPVYANILGTAIVVAASYFGHKYFSFARRRHET